MKFKKLVAAGLAAAMMTGMLAGCGSSGGSDDTSGSDNGTEASAEDVTIWYYWETEGHQVALDKVIEDYNNSQDTYEVTAKYVPFADFKKQLSIGASADELPDIAILDSPDHASYATMGIFEDLTGKFDVDTYYEGAVDSCTLDGTLYGVPFGVNCLGLYYNEDLLNAAGCSVPTTWDELMETAKAVTTDSVSGLAFCSVQNEEGTFNFTPWLWSTGASSYEIDSEGGIRALAYAKELIDSGVMSKECTNWTQGDVMNQFIAGNVAMMVNGPWQIPTMQSEAPDLNWKVTLIPKDTEYASCLGGENYAVVKGGNTEGALDFLEYATEEEQVKYMMDAFGYISADQTIAESQFEADSPYQPFVEELQYAQARGPLADWPSVSDAISLAFNEVMTGTSTPEDAAAKAQETIDGIVE
ncbi:MAG TPA: ABC transporter substrate-binding protein [Candidatus Mediterraneibacter merdavium]|nr:ABC transporter substrate-binding protein [Candidatus Mediterraneibacter merdavium]